MTYIPMKGRPNKVVPLLNELIREVVDGPLVSVFEIGWGREFEKARNLCDYHYRFILFSTELVHDAVLINAELKARFSDHAKFSDNIEYDSVENHAHISYHVYICVWARPEAYEIASSER
jgi:hypothetical protein